MVSQRYKVYEKYFGKNLNDILYLNCLNEDLLKLDLLKYLFVFDLNTFMFFCHGFIYFIRKMDYKARLHSRGGSDYIIFFTRV